MKWVLIAFVVLVIGGASVAYLSNDDGQSTAEVACEDLVKKQLKAPSSAEFDQAKAARSAKTWTVEGTVESKNGLGHNVAADYVCSVKVDGDRWTGRASVEAR